MRIALVHLGRRGAAGPISLELGTHLSEQADVLAVLSSYSDHLVGWKSTTVESIIVPTYRNGVEGAWTWLVHRRIRKLAEQIRAWKPDVLFFPAFYTWNPFVQYYLQDIPGVITVHDPVPHPGVKGLFYRMLEDYSIRRAKRYLLLSQTLAPALVQRGAVPEHIDVAPLGILNYAIRDTNGGATPRLIGNSPPILLFFGRITEYKGLDVLLRAFLQLRQERALKLQIVGAGSLVPYTHLLRNMKDIEIVNRWIEEEEIQEGVITIAASFARPVVGARIGGIVEQIDDGRTGLLVSPGSEEELVLAVHQLLDDPDQAQRLGENLKREYLEKKSWTDISAVVFQACCKAIDD